MEPNPLNELFAQLALSTAKIIEILFVEEEQSETDWMDINEN